MADVFLAISVALLAGYSALMLFYGFGWVRTPMFSMPKAFLPKTKVSVLIAARNEESDIEKCIRSILSQNYPAELLEVIVVDDNSEDKTVELVQDIISSPERGGALRVLCAKAEGVVSAEAKPLCPADISPFRGEKRTLTHRALGKKQAIACGIKNSSGDLIITTDADCIAGEKWVSTIVAYYEQFRPKMIAGPVAFTNEKAWLEKWQSLDLCGMMAITAGALTNRFPNMCNGANLAYEKKVFEEIEGFSGIDKQASGDDVMLMLKIAKKHPGGICFLKSKDAIVFTHPEETLSNLFQQRLRWLSKGTAFPDWKVSAVLVFSYLFNLSIIINLVWGFFQREFLLMAITAVVIKTLAELPLLSGGCDFFQKRKLLWNILPAQAVHILYVVFVGMASRVQKYKWKGREFKV